MTSISTESLKNGIVLAVTETGRLHESLGSCNQDSYAYHQTAGKAYAFAVADGVSNCKNAKTGSAIAVQTVCKLLDSIENITEVDLKKKIVSSWKAAVANQWDDYGTTLNFAYIFEDKIIVGKIGDGIAAVKSHNRLIVLHDDAPFYSNETFALGERVPASAFDVQELGIERAASIDVLLMTDGIAKEMEMSMLPDFMQYIAERHMRQSFSKELENWMSELDKKNDDDKTLLFAHIVR